MQIWDEKKELARIYFYEMRKDLAKLINLDFF